LVRRSWIVVPFVLALATALAGCNGDDDQPGPAQPTSTSPPARVSLTLGIWGSNEEIDAYQQVVDLYNATNDESTVKIDSFSSHDQLKAALDGGDVPDVFMINRADLADVREQDLNRPIGDLLDDRNVDFGDSYSREALEAFASDRQLQCMPYGISPMVIYYNPRLVDFQAMAERGLDAPTVDREDPTQKPTWTFAQFQAAAQFASHPRRGIAGFYIPPTLRGLAPFIFSAGGSVFNGDNPPTSLAFSSDSTKSALDQVLPVLGDPSLTLTSEQLAEKSPLEWFREGKLGMIAGFRDLVPQLRPTGVLDFDIMPMPVVDSAATVGDLTGICIAKDTPNVAQAADFLVDFISTESVTTVVKAGYLAPANTKVALSDDFLQQGRAPVHSGVSNNSIKNIRLFPLITEGPELESAVADPLQELLQEQFPDVDALTEEIDLASQSVLAPPQTESPSPGATESPSG
jgi:multiple sugar transport system substrate-binding protein